MTAIAVDDAWQEKCLIAISVQAGSDVTFHGITETVDFDIGEKDIEGVPILNGGRVCKWTPEGDSSVTLEAYPMAVGTDTGTTGEGFFDLLHSADTGDVLGILNTRDRNKYRILVMWTNDASVTTAQSATTDTHSAVRFGFADGHFTSVKPSFTDGILKYTVTFKCPAFDKAGVANVKFESCEGTGASDLLPAIASYTSSYKFA